MLSGSVHFFFMKDGLEISNYFCFKLELITSYASFLKRQSSLVSIEALEDCELICLSCEGKSCRFLRYGRTEQLFDLMVLKRYAGGKTAQWMGDITAKHSFTYIPDAAKALVLLGQAPGSDNQIWHLPTAPLLQARN